MQQIANCQEMERYQPYTYRDTDSVKNIIFKVMFNPLTGDNL